MGLVRIIKSRKYGVECYYALVYRADGQYDLGQFMSEEGARGFLQRRATAKMAATTQVENISVFNPGEDEVEIFPDYEFEIVPGLKYK